MEGSSPEAMFPRRTRSMGQRALLGEGAGIATPRAVRYGGQMEESPESIRRSLHITSEDDLWLSRYVEPIPIQSEPDTVTMSNRREAILNAPVTQMVLRSPLMLRKRSNASETSPNKSPVMSPFARFGNAEGDRLVLSSPEGTLAQMVPMVLDASETPPSTMSPVTYSSPFEEGEAMAECDTPWGEGQLLRSGRSGDGLVFDGFESDGSAQGRRSMDASERDSSLDAECCEVEDVGCCFEASSLPNDYASDYGRRRKKTVEHEEGSEEEAEDENGENEDLGSEADSDKDNPYADKYNNPKRRRGLGASIPRRPAPVSAGHSPSVRVTTLHQKRSSDDLQKPQLREADFDWNKQFQQAMDGIAKLNLNTHYDNRLDAYQKLSQLVADFSFTVKTYAKIIISEVYLPNEEKTIKPINGMDSYCGGDKFIVHNILFKFALDKNGVYGGDENAARMANHDLKSLIQAMECWEPGLHFPMMALVDYRGFRVVGMTLLPINESTLVHGSSDRGKTCKTSPLFEDKLRRLATRLNLKSHYAGPYADHWLSTPVELEGHVGKDGNLYLVDFCAMYPPERASEPGKALNRLKQFRPEFLRSYSKALSSDAFSNTVSDGVPQLRRDALEKDNKEVEEAALYLKETVIPQFAKAIVATPTKMRSRLNLILQMHAAGINVRYLGALHQHCKELGDEYWCLRIMIEMIARVIKNDVRSMLRIKMRNLRMPGESAYRSVIVSYLNVVFGNSPASMKFWTEKLLMSLAKRFPPFVHRSKHSLLIIIVRTSQRLGLVDGRCMLFREISRMLSLVFSNTTFNEMTTNSHWFERYQPFTDTDLKEMREKLKEMSIASHASGFMLKVKSKMTSSVEERRRLLSMAVQQFEAALEANPDSRTTLRNMGECFIALGKNEEAQDCYLRALRSGPNDTTSLYKYAVALDKLGRLDDAEEHFLLSLEACPTHSNCCYYYADFLCYHRKNYKDAERFYQRSLAIDPSNRSAANNYAVFCTTMLKDYDHAEELFKRAVKDSKNVHHVANYASFLMHIRRNADEAHFWYQKVADLKKNSRWK